MNLLLATSPHVKHARILENDFKPDPSAMYTFAPVGLLSLYAVVRATTNWHVQLFDTNRCIRNGSIPCSGNFYEAAAQLLSKRDADVVGFMTECDSYHHVLQICKCLKRLRPASRIILGGPHASAVADATMAHYKCIDAIVKGEAEESILALLDYFETGRQLGSADPLTSGIVLRNQQGQVQHLWKHRLVENLDDLPIPAYDIYKPEPAEEIFVEVGRGCPFKCEFCSTAPFWNRKHRVKSPERISSEIALLRRLFSVQRVHFTHDLFTTDQEWVVRVCESLLKDNVPVAWTCSARTDTVDTNLLRLMKSAGCRAVYFGIESGSKRVLKEIRKDISIELSLSIVEQCKAVGIVPNVGFILGFPTEDEFSMRDTFAVYTKALRIGAKPAHIFGYCPFAQSSLYPKMIAHLHHSGHYLDIPLGIEADAVNRKMIGASAELFGSYYRVVADNAIKDLAEGIDEFSPLVEATLVPTLLLADSIPGGMIDIYRNWVGWIRKVNQLAGKPLWRRSYGSAIDYVSFLRDFGRRCSNAPAYLDELLQAMEIGFRVTRDHKPTSMDSYRSFSDAPQCVSLKSDDIVHKGEIEAVAKFAHDISELLTDSVTLNFSPIRREPTYLVWQRYRGQVRVLKLSGFVFNVITLVERSSARVSDLSLLNPCLDYDNNREELLRAGAEGLLTITQT